ncbi:uncharacterized protein LOC119737912 [Patiria miniata]|uniref:Uncharacterized protein n=1 Tax=Patiria miniata TaxID=46514 RepID=A0A914AWL0_PATMI|nr:uncharacterized protein LOC119737912 [Patiria miniata]XP_038068504.1 uncharacterized protein LOC119737912 [Patiria miniata]XP_038068513.1 uncharacterized protein LOC119737912 [Patiria miniata]
MFFSAYFSCCILFWSRHSNITGIAGNDGQGTIFLFKRIYIALKIVMKIIAVTLILCVFFVFAVSIFVPYQMPYFVLLLLNKQNSTLRKRHCIVAAMISVPFTLATTFFAVFVFLCIVCVWLHTAIVVSVELSLDEYGNDDEAAEDSSLDTEEDLSLDTEEDLDDDDIYYQKIIALCLFSVPSVILVAFFPSVETPIVVMLATATGVLVALARIEIELEEDNYVPCADKETQTVALARIEIEEDNVPCADKETPTVAFGRIEIESEEDNYVPCIDKETQTELHPDADSSKTTGKRKKICGFKVKKGRRNAVKGGNRMLKFLKDSLPQHLMNININIEGNSNFVTLR